MLAGAAPVLAQTSIVRDGSVGPAGVVEPSSVGGAIFVIGESDGTRPGSGPNLFQSFWDFQLGTGHTASFEADFATDNIIARVTGGAAR